ncbi:MAG: hypothetical protein A2Y62_14610 [Candidatus Fischerbacteria bacterium RBG_13_37_8]|uniref:ATPase AAA-type core domain-containing protein n=1 Tax=Candidatus Fischerbacteria bacterium RBG_13_37_8 TaxID=1817863 RepID=A0A1F5VMT5_9BACT|nr:MAG: hypothetical protein A2Y62_14610 [Candidatus Fischerbacteria bacterium RBG_13_37_8]
MGKHVNRICGITVRGFKSICDEQHMEIKPLTVLAGANSSGKSSMMQPLLLLKQTLENAGDPGALLLDGPNVRFTKAEQVLSHECGVACESEFSVRIELLNKRSLEFIFRRQVGKGFELTKMIYGEDEKMVVITAQMTHEEIIKIIPNQFNIAFKILNGPELKDHQWSISRERCFFKFVLRGSKDVKQKARFSLLQFSPIDIFIPFIKDVIHVPGLRGNPLRTYPKTAGGPNFPGTFEFYVASIISQWQSNSGGTKLKNLSDALETMGLTWKVRAEPIDDTQVELKVGRLPRSKRGGAHDLVSIADVGFGVSQCLPVIVALLVARSDQLVYLEQPEIHLHPLAQRKLVNILCKEIKKGIVAVVETHSTLVLREIQTLIARGELSKEDVALHWLQRNEKGKTTICTAELDDNGAYGDWPDDFELIGLQSEQAYLDAVEKKEAGKKS